MAKITNIEQSADKNGTPMRIATFDGGQKVWVNSKYDGQVYEGIVMGAEHELHKEGNFWKIGGGEAQPAYQSKKGVEIEQAQNRKSESIAWFNANNLAVQMLVGLNPNASIPEEYIKEKRDWFLKQWEQHNDPTNEDVGF